MDAFVVGLVALEPAQRLLELARRTDSVAATRLVPRNCNVNEALVEIALGRRSRAPGELELLVSGEKSPCTEMLEAGLVRVSHAF
jgi:hypothetical protein